MGHYCVHCRLSCYCAIVGLGCESVKMAGFPSRCVSLSVCYFSTKGFNFRLEEKKEETLIVLQVQLSSVIRSLLY